MQKYDTNHIIGTYNLTLNYHCKTLEEWTNVTGEIPQEDLPTLEKYRDRIEKQGAFWNEEELKMRFIAFLFDYVEIEEAGKINIFFERTISTQINQKQISVKCDCMLAKPFGIYEPQAPYFFLQEFKKQKQTEDAEGQMLMGMLLAQVINVNQKPVYGCYLQGKYWVFCMLHDKDYCISRTFEITRQEDLFQVIFILKKLKEILLDY
jgi:hypothetical protein